MKAHIQTLISEDQKLKKIESLFNNLFINSENVKLSGGFPEPFYKAATAECCAEIQYTHNYISSALHEVSHWCVAGKDRREQNDFGYWYTPDGRTCEEQAEFFKVEVQPQAYECLLSLYSKTPFRLSLDNLNGNSPSIANFKHAVIEKVDGYLESEPNGRIVDLIRDFKAQFWGNFSVIETDKAIKENWSSLKFSL